MGEHLERLARGEAFTGMEFYLPYLYPRPANLLAYLPANALLLIDDVVDLRSAALGLDEQAQSLRAELVAIGRLPPNYPLPYYRWEELGRPAARGVAWGSAMANRNRRGRRAFIAARATAGRWPTPSRISSSSARTASA